MTHEQLLKMIGNRIRELRVKQGLTQSELAAKLDYEKSNMSRLESGTIDARASTLNKVANALGVSLSELLSF